MAPPRKNPMHASMRRLYDAADALRLVPRPVGAAADFAIVGESFYQPAILRACERHPDGTCIAYLLPTSTNPHDPQAVEVRIDGELVGYLSREDARSYRRRLAAMRLGKITATCAAMFTGGHLKRDGDAALIGVQLDMKPFD